MKSKTQRSLGRLLLVLGFSSAIGGTLTAVTLLNNLGIAALTLGLGFLSFIIGSELIILSEDTKKDIGPSPA